MGEAKTKGPRGRLSAKEIIARASHVATSVTGLQYDDGLSVMATALVALARIARRSDDEILDNVRGALERNPERAN